MFHTFRSLIMGWKSTKDILEEIRRSAKERVVNNENVTKVENTQKRKITFKEALLKKAPITVKESMTQANNSHSILRLRTNSAKATN